MNSARLNTLLSRTGAAFATLALAVSVIPAAHAAPIELVTNGNFSSTTSGSGQLGFNTDVTGWNANGGYNFVFASGQADAAGVTSQFGNLQLWGPGNGSANGLPASSPDGGNYVGLDGAFQVEPLTQTLTGLTAGAQYTVSFYWAGAQQFDFTGDTTEQLVVGFGGATQSTSVINLPNHDFSGWGHESFTFTADGTSDVLSFLAVGTPSGEPPFSLLDGVSVVATTPEPSSLALLATGLFGAGGMLRSRFKKNAA